MQVVNFDADKSARVVPKKSCRALPEIINRIAKSTDGNIAVKLRGVFRDLEMRSVPAQATPVPSLTDAIGGQMRFLMGRANASFGVFDRGLMPKEWGRQVFTCTD